MLISAHNTTLTMGYDVVEIIDCCTVPSINMRPEKEKKHVNVIIRHGSHLINALKLGLRKTFLF